MAKVKLDLGDFDVDQAEVMESRAGYEGEPPPKGVYRMLTKKMALMKNKNGSFMIRSILEIAEPESSPKSKYNGWTEYHYQNLTAQGAPYALQQLTAILGDSSKAKKALKGDLVTDGAAPTESGQSNAVDLKSAGGVKLLDAEGNHKPRAFRANIGMGKPSTGADGTPYAARPEVKGFLLPKEGDSNEAATEAPKPSASAAPPPLDDEDEAVVEATDEDADTTEDAEEEDDDDLDTSEAPF